MKPNRLSEDAMKNMARDNPQKLIDLISSGTMDLVELTFAAEYLGGCPPAFHPKARQVLLAVAKHEKSFVREGAIYGLCAMGDCKETRAFLKEAAEEDQCAIIRSVAQEQYEDLGA